MTRFTFIHDFYRDGYHDMLAEVRAFQECGLWTKHKRASLAKHAQSEYKALKHKFPCMDTSYWAGRLAALKSVRTARFTQAESVAVEQTSNKVIYLPLSPNAERFCNMFDCGNDAIWGVCLKADRKPFLVVCDLCRQEWVRTQTCYSTPDGWDWHEHEIELIPLPVPRSNKLVVKGRIEPVSIFFPATAIVGLGMLDMSFQIPILLFILQAVLVLHFIVWGKDLLQKFCKWLESEL